MRLLESKSKNFQLPSHICERPINPIPYGGGGHMAPPATYCKFSKNIRGPKARGLATFNIYQFCMFSEKIGTIACIENFLRHFCRRQVENVQEFPQYSQNHKNQQYLPESCPNESIFGYKLDIDNTNISCNFGEILTS